jgi:hypothetical protein
MKEPIERSTATAVKSPMDELLEATDRRIAALRLRLQSEEVAADLAACLEIRERFVRNFCGRVLH